MKLGINTYTFMWAIGFPGASPETPLSAIGLLDKARLLGVKVVQMGPNLPLDRLPEGELSPFILAAENMGVELELGTRGIETEHLEHQVELSRRIGSKLLRTVPEIGGKSPDLNTLIEHLKRIRPLLESEGVRLGLENGSLPAESLRAAIEGAGSAHIGVVLDMVNSLVIPEGWKEVTRILAPYTMCLHYKDFIVRRSWSMMGFTCEGRPAGRGQIDTRWLLEALKVSPYDFNVILELWPPEQETLEETILLEADWAIESIGYLRGIVRE
jgi:sugar phosphate isomerase/epimerase